MNSSLYNQYRSGIRVLISIVFAISMMLLFKIFTIQVLNHGKHEQELSLETIKTINEQGARGKIFDRNGKILADNIEKFDFWVNTNESFDTAKITSLFSKAFNKDEKYYQNLLSSKKTYLYIEKGAEKLYCKNILSHKNKIAGLRFAASEKRLYPYDNLTSSIVGFFDSEESYAGIEYLFNQKLLGDELEVDHKKLDNGKIEKNDMIVSPGKNITLTIDIDLQAILRNELKRGVEKNGGPETSGSGVIVDPYTGEILAMASYPDFNPNQPEEYSSYYYQNTAISNSYEPGSTFKVVAMAAAIDNSLISINDTIDCENGKMLLKNRPPLHDHEPKGRIPVSEVFAYSSNIGMAKISNLLTRQQLYNKAKDFGFGSKTAISMPGEQSGLLRHFNDWSFHSGKSISMGQEISCTTLQLAMAYASIANGGYLKSPVIIKAIDKDSYSENYNIAPRRVMSYQTSAILIDLLEKAVSNGGGANAYIPGYSVAGKTGTAQKSVDGSYSNTQYISSFASIFPSKNPQYVCVVSIDSPDKSRGKHWGNETAAPIVKNIYKNIINIKGLKPENYIARQTEKYSKKDTSGNYTLKLDVVPDFKGKSLKQAIKASQEVGLLVDKPSDFSGVVVWQSIAPGSILNKKDICKIKMTN